ncbi:MAG: PAS domain S-box protein [Gammaproteobacteria bacterium]|nr:PAS domain S-box protein [Gammaproteobacteria bacterium]
MHRLLARQIRKATENAPDGQLCIEKILELVGAYYDEVDRERRMTDRSIQLMSEELTELHRRNLEQTESRFRSIMQNVTDCIITLDENGSIRTFNATAESTFGYGAREVIGKKISLLIPAARESSALDYVERLLRERESNFTETASRDGIGRHKNGENFAIAIAASKTVIDEKAIYILSLRNVTERRRQESALRESEARFRTLVDNAPEAIVVFDVDAKRFVDVNDVAAEMFGLSREEMLRVGPAQVSPEFQPDGRSSDGGARESVEAALKGEVPVFEWLHCDASGREFPAEVRMVRLPAAGKRLIRGSITNIRHRKRSELLASGEKRALELLAADASLEAVLGALADIVNATVGGSRCAMMLLDEDEEHLLLAAAPGMSDAFATAIKRVGLEEGMGSCARTALRGAQSICPDVAADPCWSRLHGLLLEQGFAATWSSPILTGGEHVKGTIGVYLDKPRHPSEADFEVVNRVSHLAGLAVSRYLSAQSLKKSENRFRELFDTVLDGVYRSTPEGQILAANPALVKMLGYASESELRKVNAHDLYADPEERQRITTIQQAEGQVRNAELTLLGKNGEHIVVLENARAVRNAEAQVVAFEGTLTDITERKRVEFERTKALEEFERIAASSPQCFWSAVFRGDEEPEIRYVSPAWRKIWGYSEQDLYEDSELLKASVIPRDRRNFSAAYSRVREQGRSEALNFQIRSATDQVRWIEASLSPIRDDDGHVTGVDGVARDITEARRMTDLLATQRRTLEAVAKSVRLEALLDTLCTDIESLVPDSVGSVKILEMGQVRFLAGPSVPESLRERLDGVSAEEELGSCGVAARTGEPVYVTDTRADSRWAALRDLADEFSIGACWSHPITALDGSVLGTFVLTFEESCEPLREQLGILQMAAYLAGIALDRHRSVQTQQDLVKVLEQEKERAQVTLESIGDAVITTDSHGTVDYMNPVAEQLTGWDERAAMGLPISKVFQILHEETGQLVENPLSRSLREGRVVSMSEPTMLVSRAGEKIAIQESSAPIRDRAGKVIGAVMVFHDVSKARSLQQQLSHQASHDALTGLINRREFENRLNDSLDQVAKNTSITHNLLYLDLDQFKVVNDTCGHTAGDQLLKQITRVLKQKIRASDTLARLGGDEFSVLLKNCPPERAYSIAEDLRQAVNEKRFVWNDRAFDTTVSIGVVSITHESDCSNSVMSAADVACYSAKDMGRNRVHVYREGEAPARHMEMQWVSRITKAFEEDRLVTYFQPIVSLSGGESAPRHFELLLRMLDADGKLIPPDAFIPAAERYNLMPQIDRWVVNHALSKLAHHRDMVDTEPYTLAINLSGTSLSDESFLDYVREEIRRYELSPGAVCFELTETAAIANLQQVMHFMNELKRLGCLFSLDDFGSGLSSFAYLKSLPVDYLKIDRQFTMNMTADDIDRSFIDAFNQIGHVLRVKTVAEGVEDAAARDKLRSIGVDYGQGYYFARPAPVRGRETFAGRPPSLKVIQL